MKNVQLFKKNFFKPLANKQFLLDRASFNSVKYYAFTLPRRYCYKMYRFLRNFKRLVFFKKQFYIKFTAFNKKKIDNYQLNINFFNKLNFFFINFFFDWNHTFKLKFYFRNFIFFSVLNAVSYFDDVDNEIFNLLQKNAVQLHYINKSCLIFKINKKLTILKNKFYNIKTLIKLKFFFNFILFIKITVFIVKKIPSTPSIRFKKKSNMYFLNKKIFKFTVTLRSTGGRNNSGQVVTRHRKQILLRKFIKIDQLRCSLLLPARVKMLSKQLLHKWVAYIQYSNGSLSYVYAESMLFFRTFTQTCFYENSFYTNSFFLKKLLGSVYKLDNFNQNDACFNIIPLRSKTGKFAKAAGTYCKILYKSVDLNFYFLKLPSGLTRKFSKLCIATFGRNMNKLHKKCIRGSAGRSLQFGFRSAVRGVAMNPVDHPHGGRTKTSQPEISPWGWVAKLNK